MYKKPEKKTKCRDLSKKIRRFYVGYINFMYICYRIE